jgi:hypothetical protein
LRRFRRPVTAHSHQRVAVGHLQLRQSLPLRGLRFDLVNLRERGQQGRSLGDLGHFRRWRKAFERRREDGVRVHRAAGRLVELGERQRRAQFEAARPLVFRDGDGAPEGFLSGRGIGGLALQQHFAADAVQFRFERAMAGPFGRRQRFVEDREGAVDISCTVFGLGQSNLQQPVEEHVLFA